MVPGKIPDILASVSTFVLSTNLYTYAQALQGFFAWPEATGEGEVIRTLEPGDVVIPKFAQSSTYGPGDDHASGQREYCEKIGLVYEDTVASYQSAIEGGNRAVPFVLAVSGTPGDYIGPGEQVWSGVPVTIHDLDAPLSTNEFLRLRALPIEIAAQFKATVAQGRHLQPAPESLRRQIQDVTKEANRGEALRRYSVVEANSIDEALERLRAHGREPLDGDQFFVVSPGGLPGLVDVTTDGAIPAGKPIERSADELLVLMEDAKSKAKSADQFTPQRAVLALEEVQSLLDGPEDVLEVDDFARFYDRYVLLEKKINQALELSARSTRSRTADEVDMSETETSSQEEDDAAALHGLTVEAVRAQLPDGVVLPDEVLAEAVTALRSGKHLLIGGPPGTGKSTLAEALCRAVVRANYHVATGTADWTTFDTIGGYIPSNDGLQFEPGIVLRALRTGSWLVVDELNRADIDKAFGPLFTILAASDGDTTRRVVLPYRRDGKSVEIRWANSVLEARNDYVVTPTWRLLGTLNIADKATLFQLSFAFLRRFAVINVPIPSPPIYEELIKAMFNEVSFDSAEIESITDCALRLAIGPRELGPAILKDIAAFVRQAFVQASDLTTAYSSPLTAFVTALRLYAVPQYEGAVADDVDTAFEIVRNSWPDEPEASFVELRRALDQVALS